MFDIRRCALLHAVTSACVVVLAVSGCSDKKAASPSAGTTSASPSSITSPAESAAEVAQHDKDAQSDLRNAIPAIEQCYADNNAYPPSISGVGPKVLTLQCGSSPETITLRSDSAVKYTLTGETYTISATTTDGHTFTYDSTSGSLTRK